MKRLSLVMFFVCITAMLVHANAIVEAVDTGSDDGTQIDVSWNLSDAFTNVVTRIELFRLDDEKEGKILDSVDLKGKYIDSGLIVKKKYSYRLLGFDNAGNMVFTFTSSPTIPTADWFNKKRFKFLVALVLLTIVLIYYIEHAKRGKEIKIRKIPALESVDEAIGRATEMGKPILYVPGIMDIDDPQTVAGIIILGEVAQRSALYDAQLNVPVCRSMVMSTGRETVKESYIKAGRPDSYKENMVHYMTDDQFGYASGVNGIMLREKPAAVFMLGTFYAESLLMAETGNSIGAIQIAGTAMPSQLPFFVASCDYTLIGEELFAASAYLSKNPQMLGTLRGQDVGKLMVMIMLVIGVILTLAGIDVASWFTTN